MRSLTILVLLITASIVLVLLFVASAVHRGNPSDLTHYYDNDSPEDINHIPV